MGILDLFDNVVGNLNYIDRLQGIAYVALRNPKPRNKQKYSKYATERFAVLYERCDRDTVLRHLGKYGVDTFEQTHDAKHLYFKVRKNQAVWTRRLLGDINEEGGGLWSPRRGWKDKQK